MYEMIGLIIPNRAARTISSWLGHQKTIIANEDVYHLKVDSRVSDVPLKGTYADFMWVKPGHKPPRTRKEWFYWYESLTLTYCFRIVLATCTVPLVIGGGFPPVVSAVRGSTRGRLDSAELHVLGQSRWPHRRNAVVGCIPSLVGLDASGYEKQKAVAVALWNRWCLMRY